jgi:hypothetical protein
MTPPGPAAGLGQGSLVNGLHGVKRAGPDTLSMRRRRYADLIADYY